MFVTQSQSHWSVSIFNEQYYIIPNTARNPCYILSEIYNPTNIDPGISSTNPSIHPKKLETNYPALDLPRHGRSMEERKIVRLNGIGSDCRNFSKWYNQPPAKTRKGGGREAKGEKRGINLAKHDLSERVLFARASSRSKQNHPFRGRPPPTATPRCPVFFFPSPPVAGTEFRARSRFMAVSTRFSFIEWLGRASGLRVSGCSPA